MCYRSRPASIAPLSCPAGGRCVELPVSCASTRRAKFPGVEEGADIGRMVVNEIELQDRVTELGKDITSDYAGRPPLLVGVLKGAFVFMSDLSRAIDLPVEFDFMAVSSYGSATRSSGVVRIIKDLDLDLTDRHVLIVEDIVDSGLTLAYLRKNLAGAQSRVIGSVCIAREGRPAARRARLEVRRLPHTAGVRRRLRTRCRRALSQSALHRRVCRHLLIAAHRSLSAGRAFVGMMSA